jgi:hypothetical protein
MTNEEEFIMWARLTCGWRLKYGIIVPPDGISILDDAWSEFWGILPEFPGHQ